MVGRGFGFGFGGGRGGGRGRRNWFYATGLTGWQRAAQGQPAYGGPAAYPVPGATPFGVAATQEQELAALRGQAEYLEDALKGIRERMEALEARAPEKAE